MNIVLPRQQKQHMCLMVLFCSNSPAFSLWLLIAEDIGLLPFTWGGNATNATIVNGISIAAEDNSSALTDVLDFISDFVDDKIKGNNSIIPEHTIGALPRNFSHIVSRRRPGRDISSRIVEVIGSDPSTWTTPTDVMGFVVIFAIIAMCVYPILLWRALRESRYTKEPVHSSYVLSEWRTKRAAHYKATKLLQNALSLHSATQDEATPSLRSSLIEQTTAVSATYSRKKHETERVGGLWWTQRKMKDKSLFSEEGIWLPTRSSVVQMVQGIFVFAFPLVFAMLTYQISKAMAHTRSRLEEIVHDFDRYGSLANVTIPDWVLRCVVCLGFWFMYICLYHFELV